MIHYKPLFERLAGLTLSNFSLDGHEKAGTDDLLPIADKARKCMAAQGYEVYGLKDGLHRILSLSAHENAGVRQAARETLGVMLGGSRKDLGGMTINFRKFNQKKDLFSVVVLNDLDYSGDQQAVVAIHELAHVLTPLPLREHLSPTAQEALAYTACWRVAGELGILEAAEHDCLRGLFQYQIEESLVTFLLPTIEDIAQEILTWTQKSG